MDTNPTAIADPAIEALTANDQAPPSEKKEEALKQSKVVLDSLPKLQENATQGKSDTVATKTSQPTTSQKAPGSFESDSKIGWNSFSCLPNPGQEEAVSELVTQLGLDAVISLYKGNRATAAQSDDLVSRFLSEAYYGQWYHNAAVIIASVVFTWLITKLGGGLMGCVIIGAFLATYYQTSIRRLRRAVRDDLQRELAINRLETEAESADWINHFLSRFWLIYEPVLSAQIIGTADAILVESTPSFLDSIRLTTFTLGSKAPRIESIKTITKTEPNVVCMDWKFSFLPNDIKDLTQLEAQAKVNPKIVLTIRVGKGFIGTGIPILLEDLEFSGHLRLKFKMFNEFPHIKTIEASFLEKPHFDYSLKPVGGDNFGFDITNIPGLQSFIREQVHATLEPMMYAPNTFVVDVAGIMSGGVDLNSANGVLIVKIHSASGLKDVDLFGSIDPYVRLHVGNVQNPIVGQTKHIEDNRNPKFDETFTVLLNTPNDLLCFDVRDRNVGRTDSSIGVGTLDLKALADSDNIMEGISLPITNKGKVSGEIKVDLHYFPSNLASKLEDGTYVPPIESDSGILRFVINECKELGGVQKSGGISIPIIGGNNEISAHAVLKINNEEKLKTSTFKRSKDPRWYKQVEVFVPNKKESKLNVTVYNDNDDVLGTWDSTLEEFEEDIFINGQDWWKLKNGAGKIHLGMLWKPVTMVGYADGIGHSGYRPPIGVVRVHFIGARDLKNVEALTGGKSDPYVRVMSGVQNRGQTEHIDDDLDPEWDQVLYVPVHSKHEDLIFEVMDYNDIQKDKSLGISEFRLKDILKEIKTEDGNVYYEPLESVSRTAELMSLEHKKGRGTLEYTASFIPTLALPKVKDEKKAKDQEGEENSSETSESPEVIEKPAELPEKDLHGAVIKYKIHQVNSNKVIDFLGYESGVLATTIHSVSLPESEKFTASLYLDSNDSQFRTTEYKGSNVEIAETGTAFVKEMDFSKLVIRLKSSRDNDKDEKVYGRCSVDVRKVIERQMLKNDEDDGIEELSLLECPGGKIRLSFNFIPVVNFKLDPSESLDNQGNLTVTVVKANNLISADRGGTSDPFVRFYVDGQRVYKTETYKKTLNPVFDKDEVFTVPIFNRIKTELVAKVFDWDQIGKDTLLGEATIKFTANEIETFVATTKEYKLDQGGSITLRLLWKPELIAQKRGNTSIFSATTRVFTQAPGSALGAGGKVLGAGGKALGSGVSAIGSGIRGLGKIGRKSSSNTVENIVPVPENSTSSAGSNENATNASSPSIVVDRLSVDSNLARKRSVDENATVKVDLIEARNLRAMDRGGTSDPYCRVRLGNKQIYKTNTIKKTLTPSWNESFTTKVSPGRSTLDLKVKDYNKLTDLDIGDYQFDVYERVKPDQPFDGWIPLVPEGNGEVHIRVSYV